MARGRTPTRRKNVRSARPRARPGKPRRPSLVEAFRNADKVARKRANRRIQTRKGGRTIRATLDIPLPEIGKMDFDDEDDYSLSMLSRGVRILLGLLIIPLCGVSAITLFQRVSERGFSSRFWHTSEFFYFAIGIFLCAVWLLSGFGRKVFLYLYVLGHELTHVLFIYLSLGKVSDFSVGLDGGYVVTNKSNVLIALSPYFVPFWSIVSYGILFPIHHFAPIPYFREVLFGMLGASWSFHILFTCWMIPRDQPDLKENETFFSLMLIILANIVLLSGLICLADPELGWRDFVYNWANNYLDLFVEPFQK